VLSESINRVSRRSILLAAPAALLAAKPNAIRVASQTTSYPIDPNNFETLLGVLATLKQLGFAGFETGFLNVRSQFGRPEDAYERLKKTGLVFFGVHVALSTYDPQTAIPRWDLLRQVADGGKALGAERLIVSGGSTVHPLALRGKVEALNRIAKYCKSIHLGCSYYNHEPEFKEKAAQMEGLISQTDPTVNFFIDAEYAMSAGADVAEFFARNSRRIDAIHLRGFRPGGSPTASQEEGSEFGPLLKQIQAANWRGWLLS